MATVGELLHSVQKDDVLALLARTYEGEGEDPEGYARAWDMLLTMQPKLTTVSCLLSPTRYGIDISGIAPGDDTHYAIEFMDWAEWLSMTVVVAPALTPMSEVEQLVHVLYELTWGGYNPTIQQEQLKEIEERFEEVKKSFPPLN